MSCEQVPRALWAYRISITQQLSYSGEKANKQGCNQHDFFYDWELLCAHTFMNTHTTFNYKA